MFRWLRTGLAVAAALVLAAPASASIFVIHMHNGSTFETRFEPRDAEYDDSNVVFLDEVGVLLALSKSDIAEIESDVESSGYGHVIDDTTIALGWAPNDAPEAGTPGDEARQAAIAAGEEQAAPTDGPIYDTETLPATLQILPSSTPEGQSYVIPAEPPAATPPE